jgi:hypothetical protein
MKVTPPSGLQKTGKTLGKASGFTAFCNPLVESPYISWLLMKESYNPITKSALMRVNGCNMKLHNE